MTNGYIQIDILGKMRGLKFGMIAVEQITRDAQRLGKYLGPSVDFAMVAVIVYWGMYNNCHVKREDPDFTFEDVSDYVDEHITETQKFQDVVQCFYQSKLVAGNMVGDKSEKKSTTLKHRKGGTS
jgi:hypothetical protein